MKDQAFYCRAGYALAGCKEAFKTEKSFRTQTLGAFVAIGSTWILSPSYQWWAIIVLSIALVLSTELINTALEKALDGLHPQQAEFIRIAKDCAAGAVLVFSGASVAVFLLMILDNLQKIPFRQL